MVETQRLLKPVRKWCLKPLQKFLVTVGYESVTEVTDRLTQVSDAFGLDIDKAKEFPVYRASRLILILLTSHARAFLHPRC